MATAASCAWASSELSAKERIACRVSGGHALRMRSPLLLVALVLAACGDGVVSGGGAPTSPAAAPAGAEELSSVLAVHRAGCARCHALAELPQQVLPPVIGPALSTASTWRRSGLAQYLGQHHAQGDAADIAAYVHSLHRGEPAPPAQDVGAAAMARGEALFGELACGSCHAPQTLQSLAQRADFDSVRTFLLAPQQHRPSTPHAFALAPQEADALAAWLLAAQRRGDAQPVAGFAYECFELRIDSAAMPDLAGLSPTARGIAGSIGVDVATREDHFALRFRATLDVPASGEWQFTCGSDDGSWLFLDGQRIVANGALAPHRRRSGKVQLSAGPHELEVIYTEAAGGQSLEVLWQGPGTPQQVLPLDRATAQSVVLTAPPLASAAGEDAVARGRLAARQRRCDACHSIEDEAFVAMQPPPPAKPFLELRAGACPNSDHAAGLRAPRQALAARELSTAENLQVAMLADGCGACHLRDGRGGLPAAVRQQLVETEDLGDEGRLPPDLSAVGHRLRSEWIRRVLIGDARARPYVRVRMPHLDPARAAQYAEWFAAVDGRHGDDVEPAFTAQAVDLGRRMVGLGGRNCVTCHAFAGKRSTGPQGMDLAVQYERLRPVWWREWLLAPTRHRPTTRMPPAWLDSGPEAIAEIDAIRALVSLGAAAPLPPGVDRDEGLVLVPRDRALLHGAFLQGLSARCIAVGSPLRTHYAFDVEHARLAWLWRGDFVDAAGTWSGRAGKLLRPLGDDAVVLTDFEIAPPGARRVLGRRVAEDGFPVFVVASGEHEYEDHSAPRLQAGGAEMVRTLRCVRGPLMFTFAAQAGVKVLIDGQPAGATTLQSGQQVEVVYRW